MEESRDSRVRRFLTSNGMVILGFIFILCLIALIAVGLVQNKTQSENFKYGIVFDAGSSHTNMYIYKWSAEKVNDTGLVYEIESCKVKGRGISSYRNLQEIPVYLSPCMGRAKDVIPTFKHQETPVYLGATAGMRLLRFDNKELVAKILSSVSSLFKSYPFNFQGARILSDAEEGSYGWITINYVLGKLKEKQGPKNLSWRKNESLSTFGALDLGGASTQITFVPVNKTHTPPKMLRHFRLYGRNYTVFTHSFLCFGKDQALLWKLARKATNLQSDLLLEPCFHPGYSKTVATKELYGSYCSRKFYNLDQGDTIRIQGTGNFLECQKSILELFSASYCNSNDCVFDSVHIPPIWGKFGAFSAYYYAMNFLNLTSENVSSEEMVTRKMEEFCSTPWAVVNTTFAHVSGKYLSEYCFSGTYVLALLQKFGFKEYWNQVEFLSKINGNTEAGWSLGYMLNLTNMIPAELPPPKPFSRPTYITLMVFFSLLLAVVFILGSVIFQKSSHFWN
ncbi:ectonucleoside triphosphate diphosphohydrolase 1 isoform X1 [Tenrec ecaudatus]|uniref:ectonucleoside triphosphate diphosphohydrolase 1 isoform X1 n=3 Tax=Tenrec ecaudatus TaxID=94439 RepID=UPI003F5ACEA8